MLREIVESLESELRGEQARGREKSPEQTWLDDIINFGTKNDDTLKELGYYNQKVTPDAFVDNLLKKVQKEDKKLYSYWKKNKSADLKKKIMEL